MIFLIGVGTLPLQFPVTVDLKKEKKKKEKKGEFIAPSISLAKHTSDCCIRLVGLRFAFFPFCLLKVICVETTSMTFQTQKGSPVCSTLGGNAFRVCTLYEQGFRAAQLSPSKVDIAEWVPHAFPLTTSHFCLQRQGRHGCVSMLHRCRSLKNGKVL